MAFSVSPGSSTAIGSLPHREADAAVSFVLDSGIDIPFWPQLPKRDFREWMVPQYGAELPGLVIDEERKRFTVAKSDEFVEVLTAFYERVIDPDAAFPLKEDHAAGYYEFVRRLKSEDKKRAFVKGHVTGPLTFVLGLNLEDGRPIYADEELRQAAIQLIARNAAWQAQELKALSDQGVVIFIDEPIYSALGTAAYLSVKSEDVISTVSEVSTAVRAAGGSVGLHCCGNADWETVLSSDIDILSFDAWEFSPKLAMYAPALGKYLDRGGVIAWGVVPTNEAIAEADETNIAAKLDDALKDMTSRGLSEKRLKEQSIVTPSCGCGSLTLEQTEKVFRLLAAAGEHLKSKL